MRSCCVQTTLMRKLLAWNLFFKCAAVLQQPWGKMMSPTVFLRSASNQEMQQASRPKSLGFLVVLGASQRGKPSHPIERWLGRKNC